MTMMRAFSEEDRKALLSHGSLLLRATHTEEETDEMNLESPLPPPAVAALKKTNEDLRHRLSARIPCRALLVSRNILAGGEDLLEKFEAGRADRVKALGRGVRNYVKELETASIAEGSQ